MNNALKYKIATSSLSLLQGLNTLFRREEAGHLLPESYKGDIGGKSWAKFVDVSDPKVQYTTQSEVAAIDNGLQDIVSIISKDKDVDTSNMVVIEKGCGSKTAMKEKSFKVLEAFLNAGMNVGLYSPWDHSEQYRHEAFELGEEYGFEVNPLDVDFNRDNPNISTARFSNVEKPRVVMEFGSSRGNISTSEVEPRSFREQVFAELKRRFRHDYELCREGGILILGTDANNDISAQEAYVHPVNTLFAENILHRGVKEGVLSQFDPSLVSYEPVWQRDDYAVKHMLVAKADQQFEMLAEDGEFYPMQVKAGEAFAFCHSIKWSPKTLINAAEEEGFQCLGTYWGEDKRVPVYVFKALPRLPKLIVVD